MSSSPDYASVPAITDLLELYRGLVAQGKLKWDDEQVRCVVKVGSIPIHTCFRSPLSSRLP